MTKPIYTSVPCHLKSKVLVTQCPLFSPTGFSVLPRILCFLLTTMHLNDRVRRCTCVGSSEFQLFLSPTSFHFCFPLHPLVFKSICFDLSIHSRDTVGDSWDLWGARVKLIPPGGLKWWKRGFGCGRQTQVGSSELRPVMVELPLSIQQFLKIMEVAGLTEPKTRQLDTHL